MTARSARLAIAASLLTLAGCTDPLGRIDSRVRSLVEERSRELGMDTRAPARSLDLRRGDREGDLDDRSPPTTNPDASELDVRAIDESEADRDVAARLQAFADFGLGLGPGPAGEEPVEPIQIDLDETFRIFQDQGREILTAEESYILAAIQVLQVRHLFSPRFFNDTIIGFDGSGSEGRFDHAFDILNTLRVTQRLPGGSSLSAEWIVRATDQLRDTATNSWVQSSELVLSADIPLLQGAGPAADEDIISAERNLVAAARTFERVRRTLLVSIADDYFSLIERQSSIGNQIRQIASLQNELEKTQQQVQAGRRPPFEVQITANTLLGAESNLASQREFYLLELDRFKVRLGLPLDVPVEIIPQELAAAVPDVTLEEATLAALDYRLDLQNFRDDVVDQRRQLRNARNDILPSLDVALDLSIPTANGSDNTGGFDIDAEELDYSASVALSLPLDRTIERAELREQILLLERELRDFAEFRDGVIVSARSAVRNLDLEQFQLRLAEEQLRINELRLEDLSLRTDAAGTARDR
ncbi:MAG: TolC family protein, partial [Planctomycetota bacterium]